jgi:eukaryotic-like serine/threonine-protein kinase
VSFWNRVKRALRPPPVAEPPAPEPQSPSEETWLRGLLQRTADEDKVALAAIGDREFWSNVTRLLQAGRERTAIELLGRFVTARPELPELTARLAELLSDRREDAQALPLLERLTAFPSHALRAHFLIAEAAERAGDEDAARRHLEAILAVDLDYPKARAHADRLRPPPGAQPPQNAPAAAPTLAGLPDGGAAFTGRYRLLRELGRGASGAVYVAHDEELDRELAIKILHPHARAQARAEARARAWGEARVAAAIRHPGVVAIYDLDEERQLLAMELCAGGSLKEVLARGPLAPEAALKRGVELYTTLDAVHRRGVVHGDVKPGNLLWRDERPTSELVLGDFGVARLVGDKPVVDDRAVRGTLGYMAPEQRRGALEPACDVYAAGVILVELLSGTAALAGWLGDRGALLRGEARWDRKLPTAVEARLAPRADRLHAIVSTLLDPDPTKRPTAADAAQSLAALGRAS